MIIPEKEFRMESNTNIIVQKDGYKTILYHFHTKEEPKAILILLHGMAEHLERYYPFTKYLNAHGIDVYLYNHRGHGTDKSLKELGFFDESKGYKKVVDDAIEVIHFVDNNKRCNKIFLMGHSMGSLIARNVIQQFDKIDGVILSGSTYPSKIKTKSGLLLSSLLTLIKGPRHRSTFFNDVMFGGKAYTKIITRTSFDWLSRKKSAVGAYIHDPYCGFICSISFYHDLLKLVSLASSSSLMKRTRNDLPILIISGDHDPVGGCGKEIKRLSAIYKKLGYHKVTSNLYADCRHELLQELNSDEVMADILTWITKQI